MGFSAALSPALVPDGFSARVEGRAVGRLASGDEGASTFALCTLGRKEWIEAGLRRALQTGAGLSLHYQPQLDMETGRMVGAEALLRWRHGSDLVSPVEFIPVAEQSELIEHLGDWVIRRASVDAARWLDMGLGAGQGIKVAVNVSAKQLTQRITGVVQDALCDAGLPVRLFSVEVTESQLAEDGALPVLRELRNAGVCLAVDDFGTGYSSLARISRMPLDIIKIDRTFVQDLGQSDGSAAVVEAIAGIARRLGLGTVAEGVETTAQAHALQGLGCNTGQGFLYGRPMPFTEFVAFGR